MICKAYVKRYCKDFTKIENYEKAWNKGKKREAFSVEWKRKMSEAKKGKHWKLVNVKRVYY